MLAPVFPIQNFCSPSGQSVRFLKYLVLRNEDGSAIVNEIEE